MPPFAMMRENLQNQGYGTWNENKCAFDTNTSKFDMKIYLIRIEIHIVCVKVL